METKFALITGANSGIGLSIAERLLESDPRIHICLGCRNTSKAEDAQKRLRLKFSLAEISILLVDVSCMSSVYKAVAEIKKRFHHLDYVYLNAGIMPVSTVNWKHFWKQLFTTNCIHMFATGDGLLQQVDSTTSDGLQTIFTTNLFGHFVMLRELDSVLGGPDRPSQIIWTSSSNAKRDAFNVENIQHVGGCEPYSSSKYASDLVSFELNQRLNNKNVYSHTTCPGLVMTNLTYGILPSWFWHLIFPLIWLMRVVLPNMTFSPANGSEALWWLSRQKPESLDPKSKYHSRVSVTGRRYTDAISMDIDPNMAARTFEQLCALQSDFKSNSNNSM